MDILIHQDDKEIEAFTIRKTHGRRGGIDGSDYYDNKNYDGLIALTVATRQSSDERCYSK